MPTPTTIPSGPFAIGDDLTTATPRRPRTACIPPSPLHVPADRQAIPTIIDDTPACARRRAVGAELYRREMDARALPLADAHAAVYGEGAAQSVAIDADRDREDPAVLAVAEMLPGSPEERRHRAREILTVVRLLESRAALAREVADVGRAIDDLAIVREAFEANNVKHGVAHHYAAIAVEALRRAGRLA
jgi:hypothetical protein